MARLILFYGLAMGAAIALMEWMDYKRAVRAWATEVQIGLIALLFIALGIWVGFKVRSQPRGPEFCRNDAAIQSLGISARECEVLELLAAGHANKVIARKLSISPNTVKSHTSRLFEKLEVTSRTQAISRARALEILP